MSKLNKAFWQRLNEVFNHDMRLELAALGRGRKGKHHYTSQQRDYVLSLVVTYGVRGTARVLQFNRRTIQRWCRQYGVRVRRCPEWVYEWAERRRKRREFWQRRGYY